MKPFKSTGKRYEQMKTEVRQCIVGVHKDNCNNSQAERQSTALSTTDKLP